jgi:hypothetical protein
LLCEKFEDVRGRKKYREKDREKEREKDREKKDG